MPLSMILDEDLWKKAKKHAKDQGRDKDYAYVMGIYKKSGGRLKGQMKKAVEPDFLLKSLLKARIRNAAMKYKTDVLDEE